MYGINYSGGDNRTHGQIERVDRIDSFEAGKLEGWGTVILSRQSKEGAVPLRCERCAHYGQKGRELVRLSDLVSGSSCFLVLARIRSGFGGNRAFWLCPICGKRARFLYLKGQGFVCRECAKLNYASQQRTKSSINHYRDGLRLAREKLRWAPTVWVPPEDFPELTPPCPRYMHKATYLRHLARFRQYQEEYERDKQREMLAILRQLSADTGSGEGNNSPLAFEDGLTCR